MTTAEQKGKNNTQYDYIFEKTIVRYVVMDEGRAVFLLLLPKGLEHAVCDIYETVHVPGEYPDHRDWFAGSLVHLHLRHHINSSYGNSYKFSQSTRELKFERQEHAEQNGVTEIKTYLCADEGYGVCHVLRHYDGENGFETESIFYNGTSTAVTLELLTSASLDNLCPFLADDGSNDLVFHEFRGGWSLEGKHIVRPLPEMNMEKSWGGSFESERIGSIGSKSVGRYFPYAAIEDTKHGCTWGMKLRHNATWQAELTRYGVKTSLSIGLGDFSFGSWCKRVESGECFISPTAYIAAVRGDIADVSNALLQMHDRDADAYGEEGMPLIFNEWCTSWGNPTHDGMLRLADILQGSAVRYLVIDAGWFDGQVGDWQVKQTSFPYGLKAYTDDIRKRGLIPGIWMEFECLAQGAKLYAQEYESMQLQKCGYPLCGTINNTAPEKYLDFRKQEVLDYLSDAVIGFLRDNGFGYLKVDYNSNIGIGCDGAESLGEGLRRQMEAVYRFFKQIKEEIPDIIIENCASGGSRLDSMMMSASAMGSFSDAHESFEIPVIAANLQYLIPPRQSQIWCVLRKSFDECHMRYIIAAGFLGRLCWSGDFEELSDTQREMVRCAEAFYQKVSGIIKNGNSRIYRTSPINCRNLCGTQAVVRYSADGTEALVVYHCFRRPQELQINLGNLPMKMIDSLYPEECKIDGNRMVIDSRTEGTGNVIYLKNL